MKHRVEDELGGGGEKELAVPTLANGSARRDDEDRVPTLATYNNDDDDIEAAVTPVVIGPVVTVQPTNQELAAALAAPCAVQPTNQEPAAALAAAASLDEAAEEDLEAIAAASSTTTDSSFDEADIDFLEDAYIHKVGFWFHSGLNGTYISSRSEEFASSFFVCF